MFVLSSRSREIKIENRIPRTVAVAAVIIVARRRGVGSTVRLASRLDPDESILQCIARIRGRTHAETRSNYIAPVAPGILGSRLDTVTACKISSARECNILINGKADYLDWRKMKDVPVSVIK